MKRKHCSLLFVTGILMTVLLTTSVSIAQSTPSRTAQEKPMPALTSMKLDHVAIRVPNFEETVQWYGEKLGFKEVVRWKAPPYIEPNLQLAYLERNGAVIEIVGGGNPKRAMPPFKTIKETFQLQGYMHVCLKVDDMDAVIEEFKQRGLEVFAGPNVNSALNRKFIHVRDNNGFDVEFVEYL